MYKISCSDLSLCTFLHMVCKVYMYPKFVPRCILVHVKGGGEKDLHPSTFTSSAKYASIQTRCKFIPALFSAM